MNEEKRATFGGRISAVLVAAGSAVGLGNIWRFPYLAGENGGGAFLVIYLAAVLLIGLPLMLSEFSLGTATKHNAVGAFRQLNKRWVPLGYMGVLSSVLILGFYLVVAGWTAEYMIHSLFSDQVQNTDPQSHVEAFNNFISNPWKPVLYALLFSVATHLIITRGVQQGIERASKVMMPLLFLALAVLAVNAILMPGGMAGLRFFLKPDFSKVTAETFLMAVGQAFFSLSIGLGTMITYASYFKKGTSVRGTALQVTLLDSLVAVLAGLVIFPTVFSAGLEPGSGPSLVFITLPSIFCKMPMSALWSTIFFLLLVLAALTSTISMHESATAYLEEEWKMTRRKAAWCVTIFTGLLGVVASLSLGIWKAHTLFGLTFFDLLDYLTANIMLPLGALLTCVFVGWKVDRKLFEQQLYPDCRSGFAFRLVRFLVRYVCPVLLVVLFADNIGLM